MPIACHVIDMHCAPSLLELNGTHARGWMTSSHIHECDLCRLDNQESADELTQEKGQIPKRQWITFVNMRRWRAVCACPHRALDE